MSDTLTIQRTSRSRPTQTPIGIVRFPENPKQTMPLIILNRKIADYMADRVRDTIDMMELHESPMPRHGLDPNAQDSLLLKALRRSMPQSRPVLTGYAPDLNTAKTLRNAGFRARTPCRPDKTGSRYHYILIRGDGIDGSGNAKEILQGARLLMPSDGTLIHIGLRSTCDGTSLAGRLISQCGTQENLLLPDKRKATLTFMSSRHPSFRKILNSCPAVPPVCASEDHPSLFDML